MTYTTVDHASTADYQLIIIIHAHSSDGQYEIPKLVSWSYVGADYTTCLKTKLMLCGDVGCYYDLTDTPVTLETP